MEIIWEQFEIDDDDDDDDGKEQPFCTENTSCLSPQWSGHFHARDNIPVYFVDVRSVLLCCAVEGSLIFCINFTAF